MLARLTGSTSLTNINEDQGGFEGAPVDVAQNRLPHYHASEEVLHRARAAEYAVVLPGHAITTLHYIIEEWSGASLANQTVDGLLAEFDIHPPDKTNFNRARQLTLGDSEDAVVAVIVGCLRTNGLESKT